MHTIELRRAVWLDQLVKKANVLIEALPYIRNFCGKTFVIKYGGAAMVDESLRKAVALDLILMRYVGLNPVVVHGGGPAISKTMQRMGKEPVFVDGMRVTDAETMEIVEMVLVGRINKEIVSLINQHGGQAVGISGKDGNLIRARKMQNGKQDLGFVGEVTAIDPRIVNHLTEDGYIPVITPVGMGEDGETYNINADLVAGRLAVALQAEKLIMLTDVEGIFANGQDPSSLISQLSITKAREMIASGQIRGGMIPKVTACIDALEHNVPRTHIIDGRKPHSLLLEIFTNQGIGTMVTKEGEDEFCTD
ncbi:MAG TPA: acetylglutamate kinase [Firmicutes bacterium]|nr:acetylglutamate kinase [Bacillota bacterium]